MWIYEIKLKRFIQDTPEVVVAVGSGYSGFEQGKDNPAMQNAKGLGPLPTGAYWMDQMIPMTQEHGPIVIPLVPVPQTRVYGRGGFLIHGDSIEHPGAASHGCIILPRPLRERLAASSDRLLLVITGGVK